MARVVWLLEHSETTEADPRFVWAFMTRVANWADPPAQFALDGPFRDGARGRTVLPNQAPIEWRIGDVRAGDSYTIESDLDGAVLLCEWSFRESPEGGTQLLQRVGVAGDNAAQHADGVRTAFEPSLAAGMRRIAMLLAESEAARAAGQREDAADEGADTSNAPLRS